MQLKMRLQKLMPSYQLLNHMDHKDLELKPPAINHEISRRYYLKR